MKTLGHTIEDISKAEMPNGYVLVKPTAENDYIKIGEDLTAYIDTSFEPEKHTITFGEVVIVPASKEITFKELGIEYISEVELQVGDHVYFHYLSMMRAIRDGKYVICNNEVHYMIPYELCFCAKRRCFAIDLAALEASCDIEYKQVFENFLATGKLIFQIPKKREAKISPTEERHSAIKFEPTTPESYDGGKRERGYDDEAGAMPSPVEELDPQIIMLNGFILVEPVDAGIGTETESGLTIPGVASDKTHATEGIVRYIGKPLKGQKNNAKPGDRIIFVKSANVPLQYNLHSSLQGSQQFYRMRNHHILAVHSTTHDSYQVETA